VRNGWPIVGWVALAIAGMTAVILALAGAGEEGLRMVVRATARTSVVLFGLAFVASSLQRLWPSNATRWLLANRRYVGVSFATSHAAHLLALLALADWSFATFAAKSDWTGLILGGLGYLFVAAMTATSFDRTAAWLGPRRWQRLHTAGGWYLWFIFFASFAPRVGASLAYALPTLWMLAVLAVRWQARRARRPVLAPAGVRRGSGA
jgi:methionine sulfoxide reductase heme-binding subunit